MGITLGQLQARLIGELDVIPAASARERIKDAIREIYDEREWGIFFTDGYLRTPKLIQGQAEVEKFSDKVIVSIPIRDAIASIHEKDVDIFERQFRSISSKEVDRGFTYNIVDWNYDTRTLTIDPEYQDVTNVSAIIQILKIYYKPPYFTPPYEQGVDPVPDSIIDFKRFEYIVSPQFQRRLILGATQNELYRIDPYRDIIAEPRFFIPHSINKFGEPLFEMYPAPRFDRVFRVKYLRNGIVPNKDSDQVDDIFSKELIINKAKILSYMWAKANADKLKLKTVGRFDNLIALAENKHEKLIEEAKKKDEEKYSRSYLGNFLDLPEYSWDLEHHGETLLLNF